MKILNYTLNYIVSGGYNVSAQSLDMNIRHYSHSLNCGEGHTLYPGGYPDSGNGPLYLVLPNDDLVGEKYSIYLNITSNEVINEYDLIINGINSIYFNDLIITGLNGKFYIRNIEVNDFNFPIKIIGGVIANLQYSGKSLEIQKSKISDGIIEGTMISTLIFNQTSLGKLNFNNLKIETLQLNKANISKIEFNNVTISRLDTNGLGTIEVKEIYRHLKYLFDSIGNKTEANKFFMKEMEYHMKSLQESKNRKDYIIAWLQKLVSDFGNDWLRAFKCYLIFVLLGYGAYLVFIHFNGETVNTFSYEILKQELSILARALNPIPKVEEIDNLPILLFSTLKILLVYQIIVSLRRISQR